MFIEVIKARVPYLGTKGTRREIPDNEARVHLALGNAKEVEKPKRRVYKRRDMEVEAKPVVLEKPVPEPEPIVDPAIPIENEDE